MNIPKKIMFTKGVGAAKDKLTSFEMALRDAGIAHLNLVKVSSIFPPYCKQVSRKTGLTYLNPGQISHCVMSEAATNEPHRMLAASVGVAIPKNPEQHGYLSEHHAFGTTERVCGDFAEDLAASMLATILGVEFDPDASYDEKKEIWKISNEIVKTTSVTQSARVDKTGKWTTVLACAVFIE
jgi:arginine decarboxylase